MEKIKQRSDITLCEIQQMSQFHKEINVSISTIARYLKGRLYTMKKLESQLTEIQLRSKKQGGVMHSGSTGGRFCYIDETGFRLCTARTSSRAVKGLRDMI